MTDHLTTMARDLAAIAMTPTAGRGRQHVRDKLAVLDRSEGLDYTPLRAMVNELVEARKAAGEVRT